MSLTKRMIEDYLMEGVDVLHPEFQQSDDEYQYEQYCHYSGLPSPKAYGDE